MDVPDTLRFDAAAGKVALLLGAGASMEATGAGGAHPPSANALRDMMANRFLGGNFLDAPLSQVAEYSISETDLVTVQEFICEVLKPFSPSRPQLALPDRQWRGLATSNYDLLVETAYSVSSSPKQVLVPFIDNSDRVDAKLRDPTALAYLKLHGCVSRTTNAACPLVLAPDQFADYESGRNHVFQMFIDWAREVTLVFVGHRLDEPNFRQILLRLDRDIPSRPRYYMVTPTANDIVTRYWEKKRIRVLQGTFSEFMHDL